MLVGDVRTCVESHAFVQSSEVKVCKVGFVLYCISILYLYCIYGLLVCCTDIVMCGGFGTPGKATCFGICASSFWPGSAPSLSFFWRCPRILPCHVYDDV